MNTQDTYTSAIKISTKTIKLLEQYEIAPTPINFSVIYHYLTKKDEALKVVIDEYISWHGSLDAVFLESVFLDYFSSTEQLDKSLITPFEHTLTETMDKLEAQVKNEKEIATSFKKVDSVLTKSNSNKSLQPLVSFINKTLNISRTQHKELSEELTKTYQQVSQLKSQLKTSREEAMVDALTGLYNRRGCEEKLKELAVDATHSSLIIDIDHFKSFNDSFGHAVGDKVIQKVASTIKENISQQDFAVRQGGEEFIVVVANKTKAEAKTLGEKIRTAITQLKLKQRKCNTYLPAISVSVGIAEYQQEQSWKSVFEMADSALYQAKSSGRNCCVAI